MGESGKTEQNSDFELNDTNELSMLGWAINFHHQLLEERERNAEPPGELREGFPSRWTSKELSLSRSTSCLRPSSSETHPFDCCFGCFELVLVAQLLLDGHNTRDIGQG